MPCMRSETSEKRIPAGCRQRLFSHRLAGLAGPVVMYLGLTEKILVLDAETASPVDLKKKGQYQYWAHPETRTLMLAQKWLGAESVLLTDFERDGEDLPRSTREAIAAPPQECMLAAANVAFDQAALRERGYDTPDEKWLDILEMAYILGFSGRLDDVLKQVFRNVRKDPEGTRLITLFSSKRAPWHDEPEKWDRFREYCIHDADIEERLLRWCFQWLDTPGFHPSVRKLQEQSLIYRRINRRGIPVDTAAVDGALQIRGHETARLLAELAALTGLANPNSRDQLLEWTRKRAPRMANLQKDTVRDELQRQMDLDPEGNPELIAALRLRQELGKSSVKKFDALKRATSADGRLRGGWQFLGASRTGRVAGRTLNPANLTRPSPLVPAEQVAEWLPDGDAETLRTLFPRVPVLDTLSSCIRACLKAPKDGGKS